VGTALFRPRAAVDPLQEDLDRYLLTGDEEALERVVRGTRPRLLAAARRIGAPQDAEDAVQSAYLSLVRKRGAPLRAPVFPWLLTAVVRIAYRRKAVARRQDDLARRLARPQEGPSPLEDAAGAEGEERLRRELDRLPDRYRDPVVLHDLQGLTAGEVGRLLDLPEATVRTRVRRARALLRWRLPAGLAYGLLMVPWFLEDAAGSAGAGAAVAAMGGTMKGAAVAVGTVVAGGIGLLVGTQVGAGVAPEVVEKRVDDERAKADAASKEVSDLRDRMAGVEARVEKAEARAAKAEADLAMAVGERDEAKAALAAATAPAGGDAPVAASAAVPLPFPEYDAVLSKVEWKTVGTNMKQMLPLLGALSESARSGGKIDLAAAGRIQQLNGALVREAGKIHEDLPGIGINGAFSHPSFMVNSMLVTLAEAGKPLSEKQVEALGAVGRQFSDRDRVREAGYDERTLGIQKAIEEATLKDQFFEAAGALMSPDQRDVLWPAATKGVLGFDLFSSGIMLAQLAHPVVSTDRASFLERMEGTIVERAGIPAERREALHALVAAWGADIPEAWFAKETDSVMGMQPMLTKDAVLDAARRELALVQRILGELGLEGSVADSIRRSPVIFVPWVRKGS